MKFIEIKKGFSVRKDEIIAVIEKSDGRSFVKTNEGSYESDFSYSTILQLLEMEKIEETIAANSRNSYAPPAGDVFSGQYWRG